MEIAHLAIRFQSWQTCLKANKLANMPPLKLGGLGFNMAKKSAEAHARQSQKFTRNALSTKQVDYATYAGASASHMNGPPVMSVSRASLATLGSDLTDVVYLRL